jgi:predicted nucleic acid-binding protein
VIVLDTNVVSELMREAPDDRVLSWLNAQPSDEVWVTAMTAAELLAGVAALPNGARKRSLADKVATLLTEIFAGRILPFSQEAAASYAAVIAQRRGIGAPIGTADAVIAATCLAADADVFITRNIEDFRGTGLELLNPWDDPNPLQPIAAP